MERKLIEGHEMREIPWKIALAIFKTCENLRELSLVSKDVGLRFEPIRHHIRGDVVRAQQTNRFENAFYAYANPDLDGCFHWL